MTGLTTGISPMDRNLLRLDILERLGRHLDRLHEGGLSEADVRDLRRILFRRNEEALKFRMENLASFGRKVFEVQCRIRHEQGLPLPRSGPRELMTDRPPA